MNLGLHYWNVYELYPVAEYRFAPPRKWRFDYAWPDLHIAVEIDGGIWSKGRHVRGKGFLADMEKMNEAVRQGWKIFRFTPQQFAKGEAQIFIQNEIK